MSVREAIDAGQLTVAVATTVNPDTPIAEAITNMADRPVLVVDQEDAMRLVGILTAYDVL